MSVFSHQLPVSRKPKLIIFFEQRSSLVLVHEFSLEQKPETMLTVLLEFGFSDYWRLMTSD